MTPPSSSHHAGEPKPTFRWWPIAGARHALSGGLRLGDAGSTLCGLETAMPWSPSNAEWMWPTCPDCMDRLRAYPRQPNDFPPDSSLRNRDTEILATLRHVTEQALEFTGDLLNSSPVLPGLQALLGARLVSTGRLLLDAADAGYVITPRIPPDLPYA